MDNNHLKTLRKKYQLSQKELSHRSGLKLSRVVYLENNFNEARIKDLIAIAQAFNTSVKNLIE